MGVTFKFGKRKRNSKLRRRHTKSYDVHVEYRLRMASVFVCKNKIMPLKKTLRIMIMVINLESRPRVYMYLDLARI